MPISERVSRFALAFVEITSLTGTDTGAKSLAWHRAFPAEHLSRDTAAREARRLLARPDCRDLICYLRRSACRAANSTTEQIVRETMRLAHSNMLDYVRIESDGTATVDLSSITLEQGAAIQSLTCEETVGDDGQTRRKTTVKLYNKKDALDSLARMHGLFQDTTVNLNFSVTEIDRLIESMRRRLSLSDGSAMSNAIYTERNSDAAETTETTKPAR